MDQPRLNPAPAQEVYEEDLNFDWTNKDNAEDTENTMQRNDDKGVGYMFRSQNESDQRDVDKIARKYNIPNHYICRAPGNGKYMSD